MARCPWGGRAVPVGLGFGCMEILEQNGTQCVSHRAGLRASPSCTQPHTLWGWYLRSPMSPQSPFGLSSRGAPTPFSPCRSPIPGCWGPQPLVRTVHGIHSVLGINTRVTSEAALGQLPLLCSTAAAAVWYQRCEDTGLTAALCCSEECSASLSSSIFSCFFFSFPFFFSFSTFGF